MGGRWEGGGEGGRERGSEGGREGGTSCSFLRISLSLVSYSSSLLTISRSCSIVPRL